MKAGVITFHRANNYGAILQTWALQKVIKDFGIDACVINYHPEIIDKLYDPLNCKTGLLRKIGRVRQYLRNKDSLIRYDKFISFNNHNLNLLGNFINYEELRNAKLNLDAYIVGSDQVWNEIHTGGFDPAYFLQFTEKDRKRIAYAASVGRDYFNQKYIDQYKQCLQTFHAVSVRERSLANAVSELVPLTPEVVLDPTMLLSKEDYDDIKKPASIKEKYILVYMIEKNEQLIEFANKVSVSLGMPIIQRKPGSKFLNELPPFYTADAGEFLGLIESASYVITNSFHGTVFSILYGKPFISMLHSDTGSRTEELLQALGLQNHILNELKDFSDLNMFQIDKPEEIQQKIDRLRDTSLNFLEEALGI